jgi:hypothetical protein
LAKFLVGLVVGWLLLAGVVAVYFVSGAAPVSTAAAPMPLEKRLAKIALNARIRKEMPAKVPIQADESNYLAGAHIYRQNCAVCHGLPTQPPTALSKGMFPIAPQLFKHMVTDDPPRRDVLEGGQRNPPVGHARIPCSAFRDPTLAGDPAAGTRRQTAGFGAAVIESAAGERRHARGSGQHGGSKAVATSASACGSRATSCDRVVPHRADPLYGKGSSRIKFWNISAPSAA